MPPVLRPLRRLSAASRAYRELRVARRNLCASDVGARALARAQTRGHFLENAAATRELAEKLESDAHASDAFIRHNVGQTVRDQTSGNFVLVPKPEHLSRETAPPPPSDVNP